MQYRKPNWLCYRLAQIVSWFVATFVYHRRFKRNEIQGKKGPFVVIANHESMLDFVNLIGATGRPMSFVISHSFFSTLPIRGFLTKMGVIPKQQFQSTASDLKKIKRVIENGEVVVIYPAGLMCEDGLSTPLPAATYKFLKWLDADVYMAKTQGTYFVMPKWSKKIRPGRTYMDIYRLFSREELAAMELDRVQEKVEEVLMFDAYREQEKIMAPYKSGQDICGLENVLYQCPHCAEEFSMTVQGGDTICCSRCGFEQVSDAYGFLHNRKGVGEELRRASDWSRRIHDRLKARIGENPGLMLTAQTQIHKIAPGQNRISPAGSGVLTLSRQGFTLDGQIYGEPVCLQIPIEGIPTLPFSPGRYLELQHGKDIYRCVLDDGRLAMKYIHMVKIFHALAREQMPVRKPVRVK